MGSVLLVLIAIVSFWGFCKLFDILRPREPDFEELKKPWEPEL